MHGIWPFLLFLAGYVVWLSAISLAGRAVRNIQLTGIPFWESEMMALAGLAGFFGFIYLLSGFWNAKLVLIMLVAVHVGPLVAWFLNNAFGRNPSQAVARQFWMGAEIGLKTPLLIKIPQWLTTFFLLLYPVVAAVIYFRHTRGSPILQVLEIKCTLLFLTLNGYFLMAALVPKILASENLDDDSRQNIFFSQLGALIPNAVYGAIGAAAFGFDQNAVHFEVFGVLSRTVSLELLGILFAFFAATTLIPYLVGAQRARVKEVQLLDQMKSLDAEIEDVLETPIGSHYVIKLDAVQTNAAALRQRLVDQEPILAIYQAIAQDTAQATVDQLRLKAAMDLTGDLDARWRFKEDLGKLNGELQEIVSNLEQQNPPDLDAAAEKWAKRYASRKGDLKQQIDELWNRKPIVAAGLGSGVMIIVSGILGEVAKTAWGLISPGH